MAPLNLYNLTRKAQQKVATYRNANVADWIEAISPVLAAAGEPPLARVEDISISVDTLTISSSYTLRGCSDTDTISIPLSILTASDPVQAANIYRVGQSLVEEKSRLAEAHRAAAASTTKIAELEAELTALGSPGIVQYWLRVAEERALALLFRRPVA